MANDPVATVTEADVRALAAKLKGLHAVLTLPEQALLHAVLRRAARCGSEAPAIEEIAWAVRFNPFPYLDTIASEEFGGGSPSVPDGQPGWPPTTIKQPGRSPRMRVNSE